MLVVLLLIKKVEKIPKAFKFKINDKVRIINYNDIFRKGYTKKLSKDLFGTDFVLKTNLWTYEIKDLYREKRTRSFYEKELLFSVL